MTKYIYVHHYLITVGSTWDFVKSNKEAKCMCNPQNLLVKAVFKAPENIRHPAHAMTVWQRFKPLSEKKKPRTFKYQVSCHSVLLRRCSVSFTWTHCWCTDSCQFPWKRLAKNNEMFSTQLAKTTLSSNFNTHQYALYQLQ